MNAYLLESENESLATELGHVKAERDALQVAVRNLEVVNGQLDNELVGLRAGNFAKLLQALKDWEPEFQEYQRWVTSDGDHAYNSADLEKLEHAVAVAYRAVQP